MSKKVLNLLAFDFGAGSGRAVLGRFDGERLTIEPVHQFANGPVEITGHLYWDVLKFFQEMKQGLVRGRATADGPLAAIGIDTWGADFGLLDSAGQLLGNPYNYRDHRTGGMFEKAFERVSRQEIFDRTGIAFQLFNNLYQLLAVKLSQPGLLEQAETLLLMPDLLAYLLTGERGTEYTAASTGQWLDARSRDWSDDLLAALELPRQILTRIQGPGTIRGNLLGSLAEELEVGTVPVVAVASHDTASAVAAVPAREKNYAYLSSGTWSLLGIETTEPVINEKSLQWNLTNEGGVEGTYRVLRNVMGLWIVQECKRQWDTAAGKVSDFGELVELARQSEPFVCLIDPDDESFYAPGRMTEKVRQFCIQSGQKAPQSQGAILRCVFESLALRYRWTVAKLEEAADRPIEILYIVGGGARNELLNQFTADALDRPVVCGPSEATAVGNLLVQAQALGAVENLAEIRQVVARSFECREYQPQQTGPWDTAYERFLKLL